MAADTRAILKRKAIAGNWGLGLVYWVGLREKVLWIPEYSYVVVLGRIRLVDSAPSADFAVFSPFRITVISRPKIRECKREPRPDSNVICGNLRNAIFFSNDSPVDPNKR